MPEAGAPRLTHVWRNYSALVGSQVVNVVLGVVVVSLGTRLLGPSGWGSVALTLATAQLFFTLGVNWMMPPLVRFGVEALQRGTSRTLLASWLAVGGPVLLLTVLAAWTLTPLLVGTAAATAAIPALVAPLVVIMATARAIEHLVQASERFRAYAVALTVGRITYLAGLITFAVAGAATPATVLACFIAGTLAQAGVGLGAVERPLRSLGRVDPGLVRRVVIYAAPGVVSSAAGYASDWIDLLIIQAYGTTGEVGLYHLAYQTMNLACAPAAALTMLATSRLTSWRARGADPIVQRYLVRLVPLAAVVWALAVLAGSLTAPWLFRALFGADFAAAAQIFSLLLGAAAFQIVTSCCGPVLAAYDLVNKMPRVLVLMAVVNLAGDLLLVPRWGMVGAAAATVASFAVSSALYLEIANRRLGVTSRAPLVPPLIAMPALLAPLFGHTVLHLALVVVSAGAIVLWARRARIAAADDAILLDDMSLPRPLHAVARAAFRVLVR